MTVKHFVFVLALSIIGVGWWIAHQDSESLPKVVTSDIVTEEPLVGLETAPPLVAKAATAERTAAVQPVAAEPETDPAPGEVLVITGRLWNVPVGGDRMAATPAVGVEVRLRWFLSGMPGDVEPTDVTDETGAFRLEQDVSDYHAQMSVAVFPDGAYAGASEQLKWEKGSVEPLEVDVYRIAHSALEGQVVDRWGAPMVGARMVFMSDKEPVRKTVSDAQGRFVFPQSSRHGHVIGELPGWMTVVSPQVDKDENGIWKPVRVVMCEAGALSVRIETDEGEPVRGSRLCLGLSPNEPVGRKRDGIAEG